jgi:hypothetical protein
LLIITLLDILQIELITLVILRSGHITVTTLLVDILRFGLVTVAALVTASSIPINSLIGPIPQISTFACIRTLVLEMCLQKLFNNPTVRELLEIVVTLACLKYKFLERKVFRKEKYVPFL